ncbi:MAG: radical SAM protein [Pseudomonadales bacterium]|nr:radical SAM protein [Pseudomonadales bacterium]MCP5329763.1 radical SAM protein [Pseudomonadales bacterium]MCP5343700.1 radical SAM protein [Pseudomonadales bacterium]
MTTSQARVIVADSGSKRIPAQEIFSPRSSDSWTHTRAGDPRGYIETPALKELWIHTGSACNLACPFCLEGSSPGDTRIPLVKLDEITPFLHEAVELGVQQFSFTGGEPFVNRDFVKILSAASALRPCFVLSNGTQALLGRAKQIEPLRDSAHPIRFRISLDYPDIAKHDAGRGEGSFVESLQGIRFLRDLGFEVSIARQMLPDEDAQAVEDAFHALFREHGIEERLPFTVFPDFGLPGSEDGSPEVTETCMLKYPTQQSREHFMCTYTRMLVKRDSGVRVFACTLVDDDPGYDLGGTLAESLQPRIMLRHHRCFACYRFGASCSAP